MSIVRFILVGSKLVQSVAPPPADGEKPRSHFAEYLARKARRSSSRCEAPVDRSNILERNASAPMQRFTPFLAARIRFSDRRGLISCSRSSAIAQMMARACCTSLRAFTPEPALRFCETNQLVNCRTMGLWNLYQQDLPCISIRPASGP